MPLLQVSDRSRKVFLRPSAGISHISCINCVGSDPENVFVHCPPSRQISLRAAPVGNKILYEDLKLETRALCKFLFTQPTIHVLYAAYFAVLFHFYSRHSFASRRARRTRILHTLFTCFLRFSYRSMCERVHTSVELPEYGMNGKYEYMYPHTLQSN